MIKTSPIQPAPHVDRHEHTPPVGVKWHEYAELFPWLDGAAREELKADIAKNGVLEPVVFLGEAILDGRNRYIIARELGIEYPRVDYVGDDPLGFVLSKNLSRRHLTESQRAMVAAKLAKMPAHRPNKSENLPTSDISQSQAAHILNVSDRTIRTAKQVQEHGTPELVHAVEAGKVSVSAAAEVAKLPAEKQKEVVADGTAKQAAKEQKERAKAEKAAKQAQNDAARQAAADALPQHIKDQNAAKAEAIAARKAKPVDVEAMEAELEQARETIASLEAEVAALKADNAKWEDMRVQFEQGGFEAVIAGKDEEIRVLETRLYRESEDKASWKKSADYWKSEAIKLGWTSREVIDLDA